MGKQLTDVEATPSQPPGALVVSQLPTVAASDPPPAGELSPPLEEVEVDAAGAATAGVVCADEVPDAESLGC